MDNEPRRNRTIWKDIGCTCGGCLGLFVLWAAVWVVIMGYPLSPDGYYPPSQRVQCIRNLKEIGVAISMYAQDYDGRFPPASGFGSELDDHTVLWGAKGDIFNQWGRKHVYLYDLLKTYLSSNNARWGRGDVNTEKLFICPDIYSDRWDVPDGKVDLMKNGASYIYNAWCRFDTTKIPPEGCIEIAGQKTEKCRDNENAPLLWDAASGYAMSDFPHAQFPHKESNTIFNRDYNEINVLYADFHVSSFKANPNRPPFNVTKGGQGHFWGAPDPTRPNGTLGAQGW